jgi:hypothetical protein
MMKEVIKNLLNFFLSKNKQIFTIKIGITYVQHTVLKKIFKAHLPEDSM